MTSRALGTALARRLRGSALLHAAGLVCIAALVAFTIPVRAQSALLPSVQVAPGVWALVGPLDGPSADNHALNATYGVIATPNGTVLVDSGASAQGAALLEQTARGLTGQPVRWVINTGSQHHRWLGNDYFYRQGAQIIAHARTVQTQRTLAADQTAQLSNLLGGRFDGTQARHAESPQQGARIELNLGGLRIDLLDLGDAHFPGDAVVWLPEGKIALTGDLVYVERLLSLTPQSNGPSWLAAFERLTAMAPTHVVPGHGGPTTLAVGRAQTGDYLRFVVEGVKQHAKDMAGVEAAWADLMQAPAFAKLANFEQLHRPNVNRAYLRAEAGD